MAFMLAPRWLTANWNNLLTVGLGLPAIAFVAYAYHSGLWLELGGLIGMGVIGGFY